MILIRGTRTHEWVIDYFLKWAKDSSCSPAIYMTRRFHISSLFSMWCFNFKWKQPARSPFTSELVIQIVVESIAYKRMKISIMDMYSEIRQQWDRPRTNSKLNPTVTTRQREDEIPSVFIAAYIYRSEVEFSFSTSSQASLVYTFISTWSILLKKKMATSVPNPKFSSHARSISLLVAVNQQKDFY